ncbi:tubulin-specific chaperone [Hortaea werneckii]|nr:tubulin-specific chaperone [Hortaea werneckii]KAI7069902.1 tubulin-specific chaperone [Hortaea werneckii]KAI7224256.1 tubulin-specific chaperone [Hortaea werneckii]KAI7300518.1 tubulin-specific chaperone [Hortaea werneckii]KAI7374222.1 tubulin-specific chaperone [Hortaea werneckii]
MASYVGQRLSLKGQLCTVRYNGPVADKQGEWLGVEWDDTARGKHNGTHQGKCYFTCRSVSPTAASFLRPNQQWDKPRSFLEALKEKYASDNDPSEHEAIQISAHKQAEEVGFDKFARRQAQLRGIHTIVLDRMCIRHSPDDAENAEIGTVCKDVTDLDLSSNLFETMQEIIDIARRLPKLRSLTIDGNRILQRPTQGGKLPLAETTLPGVNCLSISNTLIDATEDGANTKLAALPLRTISSFFPNAETIVACNNEWDRLSEAQVLTGFKTLDVSGNLFESLSDIATLKGTPDIHTLIAKNCQIRSAGDYDTLRSRLRTVTELDVRGNSIDSFAIIDCLAADLPSLRHLRTAGNPLYTSLMSPDGKPLTAEDGYMLTIARLPKLETLNYSKITEKERLNADRYYLSQIALELLPETSDSGREKAKERHPRWMDLCEEYGEPASLSTPTPTKEVVDPNSLAARMIKIQLFTEERKVDLLIPKSNSVYTLLGLISKELKMSSSPLTLGIWLETGEETLPEGGTSEKAVDSPQWWCSDDEDDEPSTAGERRPETDKTASKKVQILPSTRAIGTFLEDGQTELKVFIRGK